jgi:hypothetical protein
MSIKVFQNLLNIEKYNKIEFILNEVENLSSKQNIYDKDLTTYYNYNLITVDLQSLLEEKWVNTYTSDLIDLVKDINQRNDNEEKIFSDNTQDKLYKDDLFFRRLENIKDEKIAFLNSYKYLKRFKGTKEFIEKVVRFYINTKFKNQYNIKLSDKIVSGTLEVDKKYRIIETTLNYFGENLISGNIFVAENSKILSSDNSVKEIISTDTTLKTSGTLNPNSYYIIDTVVDDYFFDGNVVGNSVINEDGTLNDASPLNIIIEKAPLLITQSKDNVYTLQSIFDENVWNLIIKPIVHPIGWIAYYFNLNSTILAEEFTQPQEGKIYSQIRFNNLGYYTQNEKENSFNKNYSLENIQNLNVDDLILTNDFVKISNSSVDFSLSNSTIKNDDSIIGVLTNYIIELKFSDNLDENTINISNLYLDDGVYTLSCTYDVFDNIVRIKCDLLSVTTYYINITSDIKNTFGSECSSIIIEFNTNNSY